MPNHSQAGRGESLSNWSTEAVAAAERFMTQKGLLYSQLCLLFGTLLPDRVLLMVSEGSESERSLPDPRAGDD